MGTVAVTGAAGNIGSVVREALHGEAARVILIDRVPLRAVRFAAVYAASANTRRFWETPDPAVLDYTPSDDAETYAAEIPGAELPADPSAPQAGFYALPEFTLPHLWP